MKLDLSKAVVDKGVGYLYVYQPTHPMANKAGKVYVHRHVAQTFYGVILTPDLVVHHKDENKLNNEPSNLEIMTYEEHGRHHHEAVREERLCSFCGEIYFTSESSNQRFCSQVCAQLDSRRFEITRESLQSLIDTYPVYVVGRLLGVSDVAIHKRCRRLGVVKKPQGFWLTGERLNEKIK